MSPLLEAREAPPPLLSCEDCRSVFMNGHGVQYKMQIFPFDRVSLLWSCAVPTNRLAVPTSSLSISAVVPSRPPTCHSTACV